MRERYACTRACRALPNLMWRLCHVPFTLSLFLFVCPASLFSPFSVTLSLSSCNSLCIVSFLALRPSPHTNVCDAGSIGECVIVCHIRHNKPGTVAIIQSRRKYVNWMLEFYFKGLGGFQRLKTGTFLLLSEKWKKWFFLKNNNLSKNLFRNY